MKRKSGYASYIVLQCKTRDGSTVSNTSKKQGHSYQVNVRAVLAFREIGQEQSATITISKVMNKPGPPMRQDSTKSQNGKPFPVVKQLANDNMVSNAVQVREVTSNYDREYGISLDDSWHKRGRVSHNSVVTAISVDTKKCVDNAKSGKKSWMIQSIRNGKLHTNAR